MHRNKLRDLITILGARRSASAGVAATVTVAALSVSTTGCIEDTNCGICDPENLVLEHFSAENFAGRRIHLLTDGVESSEYFVDDITKCTMTDAAIEAEDEGRGAAEWCKISPLVTNVGLEMIFNNLLDPESVEQVRKQPDNPNLWEVYNWRPRILEIQGPSTRYNGEYIAGKAELPDVMGRAVNLTCAENYPGAFNHTTLGGPEDVNPCDAVYSSTGGAKIPLNMDAEGSLHSYAGEHDWRRASCSAGEGVDRCCTSCDYELSVNVAKYGSVTPWDGKYDSRPEFRNPHATGASAAIECNAEADDPIVACAEMQLYVDREHEIREYDYMWQGDLLTAQRVPLFDKIRETHPNQREPGVLNQTVGIGCQTTDDCAAALGAGNGMVCIGELDGAACSDKTVGCVDKHCVPEWFGTCDNTTTTTGETGYCIDKRFRDKGAGACYVSSAAFEVCDPESPEDCEAVPAGSRLSSCDGGESPNGDLTAVECCQASLGSPGADGANCDPLFQENVTPIDRFDRDSTLPAINRECFCGPPNLQSDICAGQIETYCENFGTGEAAVMADGVYITHFVTAAGGVVYQPSVRGVEFRIADQGGIRRSLVETCADNGRSDGIDGLSVQDGWRMHDDNRGVVENRTENFDRGMCSGSEYTVLFSTPDECADAESGGKCEFIQDKVGNTLADKRTYTFQTPEFHIQPGSGFPKDNLRIGACDDFTLGFSNKYDLDRRNLRKIQIVQLSRAAPSASCDGLDGLAADLEPSCWKEDWIVAGGHGCTDDPNEVDTDTPPCLTVDVTSHGEGSLTVEMDDTTFGVLLRPDPGQGMDLSKNLDGLSREATGRYRMKAPGLRGGVTAFADLDMSDSEDVANFEQAFKDVCGMPLVTAGDDDFYYDFRIDRPKCKEDPDGDGIPLSCDNADDHTNPGQADVDGDSVGDIVDLCVLVAGDSGNTGDSDKDGIGNDCDNCRATTSSYFKAPTARMRVRNIPFQFDADQDGIGDVCDNCIVGANCEDFGANNPWTLGTSIDVENDARCQYDADENGIGEACEGLVTPNSAGEVGFGEDEDWDQDGIQNIDDACPRQPLSEQIVCAQGVDADCNPGVTDESDYTVSCSSSPNGDGVFYCNHRDADGDGVGDFCDTCPYVPNALQVAELGFQSDDPDGDFVGTDCESNSLCGKQKDPRHYGFYEVAVDGFCCVTSYPGDGEYVDGKCEGLCDLNGIPIKLVCDDQPEDDVAARQMAAAGIGCRKVPAALQAAFGITQLPLGCEGALAEAGYCDPNSQAGCGEGAELPNVLLSMDSAEFPTGRDALWAKMCQLPQWDQDYDGLGDICDLCPFSFDPYNSPYVDASTGKVWDKNGKYCNGEYAPDKICADEAQDPTDGETGDDTGESSSG